MCSRERRTKIQATARPDYLWPEIWSTMSKSAQKKERKNGQWRSQSSITLEDWEAFFLEKPKVDNARKLRGICFIDPGRRRERSHQKREEKVGDSYGGGNALQNGEQRSVWRSCGNLKREWWIQQKSKRQSMRASWKLMNPRESGWISLHQKIMKITSQVKDTIW